MNIKRQKKDFLDVLIYRIVYFCVPMRDDELRQILRARNPWWTLAASGRDPLGWVARDPVLEGARQVGIAYDPPVLADVAPPGLYVIRGPRRVGKSVSCKRLVARQCAGPHTSPWQVIYLSADGLRTQDLRRTFTLGRELTAPAGLGPRLWVIDEITTIDGWVPLVKELRDNTELAFDAVVLTGSSAQDLAEARRSLGAGRTRVADPFRIVLPMTFRQYLEVTGAPLPATDPVGPDQLMADISRRAVVALEPLVETLDLAWQQFLESGGFPRAVGESLHRGGVSDEFVFDLVSWLAADVEEGRADSVVRLLLELRDRMGAPLNVRHLAQSLGTTRFHLEARLRRLIETFGAFWCPQLGRDDLPKPGSQAKLYLIDPLLARLPYLRDGSLEDADMTQLTESQLALELVRAIDRIAHDRFVEQRAVLYARAPGSGETDFAPVSIPAAGSPALTIPIECKWVSHKWKHAAMGIRRRYGHGILATKNVVDLSGDVWAVPAPILALLLA